LEGTRSSCAAALATLAAIEDEGLMKNAQAVGGLILSGLREGLAACRRDGDPRPGLMIASSWTGLRDLVTSPSTRAADQRDHGHVIRLLPRWS